MYLNITIRPLAEQVSVIAGKVVMKKNVPGFFIRKIYSKKFGELKTSLKFYSTILPDNGSKI